MLISQRQFMSCSLDSPKVSEPNTRATGRRLAALSINSGAAWRGV
jgi:hypothetical protein